MIIDPVSQAIIVLALALDQKHPGLASEIWLDPLLISSLRRLIPTPASLADFISTTTQLIDNVSDLRSRTYLQSLLHSLTFQLNPANSSVDYTQFSHEVFGFAINRVTSKDITSLEDKIHELESKIGKTRQQVFADELVAPESYQTAFFKHITDVKQKLNPVWFAFPDQGFDFELTTHQPWGAFNTHDAPFHSRLTLNTDNHFAHPDLRFLASHEAYGGHHTELSLKDKLLVDDHRGEHGLVITLSPQTFISEGIAESIFVLTSILDPDDPVSQICWYYHHLTSALQNIATFLYFDDHQDKASLRLILSRHPISEATVDGIIGFSTDPVFGKYAPVYYSAFNFITNLYAQTTQKDRLLTALFSKPCTPSILLEEFS